MKAKLKKNRITMIMLREADQPVRRSRFSRTSLYTVLCIFVSVIASIAGWQYAMHQQSFDMIRALSDQVSEHDQVYDQMVSAKETTIQNLKSDIVQLTEKTADLRSRYEDLEELKDQVMDLLDEVEESGATAGLQKASSISVLSHSPRAVGGEKLTPTAKQWDLFVADSYLAIEALDDSMQSVSVQLDQAKSGLEDLLHQLRTTPNYWPTSSGIITSGYGIRSDPFTGSASFHSGIDIAGSLYDPVFAAADGTVTEAGWDQAKGNYIKIRHRSNLETIYMHLSATEVKSHDSVAKGQRIASLGNSGRSTGPHLHFEIIVSSEHVNPFHYLN